MEDQEKYMSEKEYQMLFEEIWKKHIQHDEKWKPLYTNLMPPVLRKREYRDLIEQIETLVWRWTWFMVHMASDPETTESQIVWYDALGKTRERLHPKQVEL